MYQCNEPLIDKNQNNNFSDKGKTMNKENNLNQNLSKTLSIFDLFEFQNNNSDENKFFDEYLLSEITNKKKISMIIKH